MSTRLLRFSLSVALTICRYRAHRVPLKIGAKAFGPSSRSLKVLRLERRCLHGVSENSSFCLFAMPDDKSWSFRLLCPAQGADLVCLSGGTPDEALKLAGGTQAGRALDTFRPYPLDAFL